MMYSRSGDGGRDSAMKEYELNAYTLSFNNDSYMEAMFRQFYARKSLISCRVACVAGTILFVFISVLEQLTAGVDKLPWSYALQAIVCCFILGVFVASFKRSVYFEFHNLFITSASVVFIVGLIIINIVHREGYTSHEVIPILVVTHISHNFLCINFIYSTSLCWILQALYVIIMPQFYGIQLEFVVMNLFLFTSNIFTIASNYRMESYLRKEFLLRHERSHDKELISKAEEANQFKTIFLANVTHELRTPIHGIWGNAQLLNDASLNESQQYHLKTITDCAQILLTLINNLLDMSKVEAGKMSLETCLLNPRDIVEEAVEVVAATALLKKLKISSFVSYSVPEIVEGDAVKLRQILVNLLGNAVKFTQQGEVHVDVTVSSESESMCALTFKVKDTGIGIKEADMPFLFQRFHQLDHGPTKKFPGSGLGLALVNNYAQLMGGELKASSKEGVGSTFQATLRFSKPRPPSPPCDGASLYSEMPHEEKIRHSNGVRRSGEFASLKEEEAITMHVLVVDASADVRNSICTYIQDASPWPCASAPDHFVRVEFSGVGVGTFDQALKMLNTHSFPIVIVNDWFDHAACSEFLHEINSNTQLHKTSVICGFHDRPPNLAKFPALAEGRLSHVRLPFRSANLLRTLFRMAQTILFGDSACFPDNISDCSNPIAFLAGSMDSIPDTCTNIYTDQEIYFGSPDDDVACSLQLDLPSTRTPPPLSSSSISPRSFRPSPYSRSQSHSRGRNFPSIRRASADNTYAYVCENQSFATSLLRTKPHHPPSSFADSSSTFSSSSTCYHVSGVFDTPPMANRRRSLQHPPGLSSHPRSHPLRSSSTFSSTSSVFTSDLAPIHESGTWRAGVSPRMHAPLTSSSLHPPPFHPAPSPVPSLSSSVYSHASSTSSPSPSPSPVLRRTATPSPTPAPSPNPVLRRPGTAPSAPLPPTPSSHVIVPIPPLTPSPVLLPNPIPPSPVIKPIPRTPPLGPVPIIPSPSPAFLALSSPPNLTLAPSDTSSTPRSSEASPRTPLRVLLCEDNVVNQMTTRRMLEKNGFTCHIAENGMKGVEAYSNYEFDIILMDVFMPICDGYTATKMIRAHESKQSSGRRVPIICLTANIGEKDTCLASGMDDYLSKPCKQEDLINMVTKWWLGNGCP